jgi:broad specificity phosphatase PhoE
MTIGSTTSVKADGGRRVILLGQGCRCLSSGDHVRQRRVPLILEYKPLQGMRGDISTVAIDNVNIDRPLMKLLFVGRKGVIASATSEPRVKSSKPNLAFNDSPTIAVSAFRSVKSVPSIVSVFFLYSPRDTLDCDCSTSSPQLQARRDVLLAATVWPRALPLLSSLGTLPSLFHGSTFRSRPLTHIRRHGARLDAADKTWHLTSPTPYDPPLTYGGWTQGKALGLRIAALLHQRDYEQIESAKDGANDPSQLDFSKIDISKADGTPKDGLQRPKKKKRKIIIHSSPFLRCVQTSTAVAAGITQYQPPATPRLQVPTPSKERSGLLGDPTTAKSTRVRSPLVEPLLDPRIHSHPKPRKDKILLRIDAFLGEWLSPDYFEDITPPPDSTLMVAGAKADLLRRGDQILEQHANSSKGHFPGGWVRKEAAANHQSSRTGPSSNAGSLAQVSPFRERSSSYGSPLSLQRTRSKEALASLATSVPAPIPGRKYEPPVPSYSVSPADPIPRGYVAHAQDACLQVDFQWDSMRPPQDWGDGGEYGDEWSTMHKRFRRGLAGMMQWYREHGAVPPKEHIPGFMFKVLSNKQSPPASSRSAVELFPTIETGLDAEDDEELVLVIVTHGAGCNALLGAISNQPVLMDIGLASLSMAVRRNVPRKTSVPTIHERRLSVADAGMSDTYEMKLLASIDHLRPGTDPTKLTTLQSRTGSPTVLLSPSVDQRRRFTGSSSANSPLESPFSVGDSYRTWNSSLGSVRRTSSSGSNTRYTPGARSGSESASSAGGLWSGARTPVADTGSDGRSSPGADMMLNFANPQSKPKSTTNSATSTDAPSIPAVDGTSDSTNVLMKLDSKEERETGDRVTPLVRPNVRTGSTSTTGLWGAKPQTKPAQGLWGPPRLDDVYKHGAGPKRRWTVTEREDSI